MGNRKSYRSVLQAFLATPWAILPEKLAEISAFLESKAGRRAVSRWTPAQAARGAQSVNAGVQISGSVALLPLFGVISQRMNLLVEFSGGTSTELYGRAIDQLVAMRPFGRSLWSLIPRRRCLRGPGLADKIFRARGRKQIVAVADSLAASAAYWLAAQASELIVTPSGMVGSVGVITSHIDQSVAEEKAGLKTTLITAGEFKAETDPSQPLSPGARAEMQRMVDTCYGQFVAHLARGRGVSEARVRSAFGQGRMAIADEAVARGMADGVGTLQDTVRRLGTPARGASAMTRAWARIRAASTPREQIAETAAAIRREQISDTGRQVKLDTAREIRAETAREIMRETAEDRRLLAIGRQVRHESAADRQARRKRILATAAD